MNDQFARAMAALTTGIYVLTVSDAAGSHGMSSSWVTQVSGEPPLIMAAVGRSNFSRELIQRSGTFGLNVVGKRGKELEDYFYSEPARRRYNLDAIAHQPSPRLRVPWLERAMVAIEARVVASHEAGDHTLFVGEMVGVDLASNDRPLTSLDLDYVYIGGRQAVARDRSGWD
ncbi:MAG TPA: flavin reductase family protein [Candidatus Binataceae bacterium]|nr:flavin reductase family protein [Candidatus Binataceae bacterium]